MNQIESYYFDLFDEYIRPKFAFLFRWYNRFKKTDVGSDNSVIVNCPECRARAEIVLGQEVKSVGQCPVCFDEEVECVVLPCYEHHRICSSCILSADDQYTSIRDLYLGQQVPKYLYHFAKIEYDRFGNDHYTLYEDRNSNIWVIIFAKDTIEYYCFYGTKNRFFYRLIRKLGERYRYAVIDNGYILYGQLPEELKSRYKSRYVSSPDQRIDDYFLLAVANLKMFLESEIPADAKLFEQYGALFSLTPNPKNGVTIESEIADHQKD